MKLNEPKVITFLIAVVLVVLGLILFFIPTVKEIYAFLVMLVAFVLLAAGNMVKGL